MRSLALKCVAVAVVAYVSLVAGMSWAMHQPPEKFGRVMSKVPAPAYILLPFETLWTHARVGRLHIGDPAPDFNLKTLDKSSHVQLSSFRGDKPVVLVFGSYT